MLPSILGARLSWHFANGWVFEPAIVRPETRQGARRPDPSPTLKIFWSNDPKLIGFIQPRLSAQLWRRIQQPIQLAGFQARIPLTHVACTSYGNTPFTERLAEMGTRADVRTATIASDHFCMLSARDETVKVLISS